MRPMSEIEEGTGRPLTLCVALGLGGRVWGKFETPHESGSGGKPLGGGTTASRVGRLATEKGSIAATGGENLVNQFADTCDWVPPRGKRGDSR